MMELFAVEGNDARRFLAPVLQGVQAERGVGGGVGESVDAEDSAFLVQVIVVVEVGRLHGLPLHRLF